MQATRKSRRSFVAAIHSQQINCFIVSSDILATRQNHGLDPCWFYRQSECAQTIHYGDTKSKIGIAQIIRQHGK